MLEWMECQRFERQHVGTTVVAGVLVFWQFRFWRISFLMGRRSRNRILGEMFFWSFVDFWCLKGIALQLRAFDHFGTTPQCDNPQRDRRQPFPPILLRSRPWVCRVHLLPRCARSQPGGVDKNAFPLVARTREVTLTRDIADVGPVFLHRMKRRLLSRRLLLTRNKIVKVRLLLARITMARGRLLTKDRAGLVVVYAELVVMVRS